MGNTQAANLMWLEGADQYAAEILDQVAFKKQHLES